MAQGSLKEFETHLQIAERIGLATHDQASQLLTSTEGIGKMLRQLIFKLAPE
ncbi:four helix bundle protein [Mesorhizobium sp. M7A.F.Ca.CA.004.04.2.1]|uniref:four helix bundle protein n=1 Tax=Mesorhizobium sp. M7A.F.Ca.CA.004.04.2.1 TaxID=2496677 RepID=UPI0024797104|nr:four helix bundle protein [Mesorhizobium sp. M7A.F.Ca.CA.004.04.2.1]